MGYTLELDGRCCGMTPEFRMYCLCYDQDKKEFKKDLEDALGLPDMPLWHFVELASKLSVEQLTLMAANMVLTEINRKNLMGVPNRG